MTDVIVSGDTQAEALKPFTVILGQMQQAWNKADAKGFAAAFGDQADFIDMTGGHHKGRPAIGQTHATLFAGPYAKSTIQYQIEKTKPLAPTVMALFLRSRLTLAGGEGEQIVAARPTMILFKGKDGWRISVLQITRLRGAPPAKPAAGEGKKAAKTKA